MNRQAAKRVGMAEMLGFMETTFADLPPRPKRIEHYAVEQPTSPRWARGDEPPTCHADAEHGPMNLRSWGRAEWWICSNWRECGAVRSLCDIRTHGEVLELSGGSVMGRSYCPDCHEIHYGSYTVRATPGRRLVAAEAYRRGGTCQFELYGQRCQDRFEHGRLQWHHRDPAEKLAGIAALAVGSNLDALIAELAKCDLLCRSHHRLAQRDLRPNRLTRRELRAMNSDLDMEI